LKINKHLPPDFQIFRLSHFQISKGMHIKILGSGCHKCKTLEKLTREVVEKNGIDATITKVEDIVEIMSMA
jgi:hypothetical protein